MEAGGKPTPALGGPLALPRIAGIVGAIAALAAPLTARGEAQGDCGTASLAALAELVGPRIPADKLSAIASAMPETGPSMLDIKQAAEGQGIALKGIAGTLEEVAGFGGPAIIHLSEPDHFLVLARLSGEWAQVIDSGRVLGVPRAELRHLAESADSIWTGEGAGPSGHSYAVRNRD